VLLAAQAAVAIVFACSSYSGSSAPADDGGAGDGTPPPVAPPPGPAPADLCSHDAPPGPTGADDAPGVTVPDVVLAVERFTLGTKGGGFDLDRVCTCDPRPGAARDGGPSCTATKTDCDLEGGVDNQLGVLADEMAPFFDVASIPNDLIAEGRATTLIVLKGWNGKPNDPDVSVGVTLSAGIRGSAAGCLDASYDDAHGVYTPGWCGDDTWSVSTSWGASDGKGGVVPRAIGKGYVTNGKLVVPAFAGDVGMPFGDVWAIAATQSMLVATLATDMTPEGVRISSGLFAGRTDPHEILVGFGTQIDPVGGTTNGYANRLCQNTMQFGALRNALCGVGLDVTKSGSDLGTAPCDAVSGSVTFTARGAKMGALYAPTIAGDGCEPGPNGQPDTGASYACGP
jgi:hypothetical protein